MAAQVAGTIAGGFAVAFLGMRFSLAIGVAVFMASGLLIGLGIRARPTTAVPRVAGSPPTRAGAGLRLVFGDRMLRTPMLLGWLVAFYTVPQGIAAPYAARLGGGPVAAGLVLAATLIATRCSCRLVRPPPAAGPDGAAGHRDLRRPGADGLSPGPGRLAGDLLGFGRVRRATRSRSTPLSWSGCRTSGGRRRSASPAWAYRRPGRRVPGGRRRRGAGAPAVVTAGGAASARRPPSC